MKPLQGGRYGARAVPPFDGEEAPGAPRGARREGERHRRGGSREQERGRGNSEDAGDDPSRRGFRRHRAPAPPRSSSARSAAGDSMSSMESRS
jgi:hypothetical protein